MDRLTAYNNLQEAKRNAGRVMKMVVDLKREPKEQDLRDELVYHAEMLMYSYVEQARRYTEKWERMNP